MHSFFLSFPTNVVFSPHFLSFRAHWRLNRSNGNDHLGTKCIECIHNTAHMRACKLHHACICWMIYIFIMWKRLKIRIFYIFFSLIIIKSKHTVLQAETPMNLFMGDKRFTRNQKLPFFPICLVIVVTNFVRFFSLLLFRRQPNFQFHHFNEQISTMFYFFFFSFFPPFVVLKSIISIRFIFIFR